ncbi:MAG TPA: chemotaxis protein CheW, partial [Myxococcales bacterium]|nr:chemotaxis protein CheW [Myxococcales bacterium]
EPIVDLAHAMETVLRSADRAPGTLRREALEPMLQALRAIEERVSALAEGKTLAPAPAAILDALGALQPEDGQGGARADAAVSLPPEVLTKLSAAEKQQLVEGVAAGKRALRADFVPTPERAAAGLTISSVRERVSNVAEIVKVLPLSRPRSEEAPGGLAFVLVLLTGGSDEAIAEAAGIPKEEVLPVAVQSAPQPAPAFGDEDEIPAEAVQRRTIRVEVGRLDDALERLSALVVTRFRLSRALAALGARGADTREVAEIMAENGRQLRDLRAAIMRARMVPVSELLERLPLVVRGITRTSGKKARVEIDRGGGAGDGQRPEGRSIGGAGFAGDRRTPEGRSIGIGGAGFAGDGRRPEGRSIGEELDKSVADRIFPALVHLVRNAVDHAIEPPDERARLGKPEEAVIRVSCLERSNRQLELTVTDDGRGVDATRLARKAGREVPASDAALLDLLTIRGLSSRDEATTTSGRGMGMDIVKRIVDQLGGELLLKTQRGSGSTFTLRVPLSITIVDAFSFACGKQPFVVPVATIEEIVEVDPGRLVRAPGGRDLRLLQRRGETVPLLALESVLHMERGTEPRRKALIVRRNAEPYGFEVDRMLGQQEVVVRPLEDPLVHVPGVTGSTDLGDGLPTLVLDLLSLTGSLGESRAS